MPCLWFLRFPIGKDDGDLFEPMPSAAPKQVLLHGFRSSQDNHVFSSGLNHLFVTLPIWVGKNNIAQGLCTQIGSRVIRAGFRGVPDGSRGSGAVGVIVLSCSRLLFTSPRISSPFYVVAFLGFPLFSTTGQKSYFFAGVLIPAKWFRNLSGWNFLQWLKGLGSGHTFPSALVSKFGRGVDQPGTTPFTLDCGLLLVSVLTWVPLDSWFRGQRGQIWAM